MITIETGVYMGIVIMGAMIVAVAVFVIMKSTSKKDITQTQKQPVENTETSAALKKRHATQNEVIDDKKTSTIWRKKRDILRGIRALRKRNAPPDQQPIDKGLAINEQFSIPLPDVTSPEPEINAAPLSPDQGVPNVEPASEEAEVNMINTTPAESAEFSQGQTQEEPESIEHEPKELNETSDNEYQDQPTTKGTTFDLFTAEMAEESDTSKLAATLNNVDVHDLLGEAQNFINQLRGARG